MIRHLQAVLIAMLPAAMCECADAQSFFPPTLTSAGVTCSTSLPGMTVTIRIDGHNPAYYIPSHPVVTRSGDRLLLTYSDGCGLLTVVTPWSLTGSIQGLPPGTYFIDVKAIPDGATCDFTPRGPMQVGSVVVPPLPCAAPCLADVASIGGTPGRDGQLTPDDIVVFLAAFFSGNLAVADLSVLGGTPGTDGQLTPDDLVLFLSRFFGGCP